MFPIFFSEISGMFPTVLTFPEKFASLTVIAACVQPDGLGEDAGPVESQIVLEPLLFELA